MSNEIHLVEQCRRKKGCEQPPLGLCCGGGKQNPIKDMMAFSYSKLTARCGFIGLACAGAIAVFSMDGRAVESIVPTLDPAGVKLARKLADALNADSYAV